MSDDTLPPADLVLQALHAIRNEVKELRGDVKTMHEEQAKTNARLDQTNTRLDETNAKLERLDRRVTEGFVETNTKLADLSLRFGVLGDRFENVITGQFGKELRDLKARMDSCEEKLASLGAHEKPPPPYGDKG
ncbi:MAG: hypothetical protein QM765_06700 [Myxococcales bacterium]